MNDIQNGIFSLNINILLSVGVKYYNWKQKHVAQPLLVGNHGYQLHDTFAVHVFM